MGDKHDYLALDWVRGEIEETLKQAQNALEAYVECPEDATRMRFCLTYLHQVYGTLQIVEFYGAALLAEEMEKLAQALLSGSVHGDQEALELLMRAILQLPAYLDRVMAGRRDMPVVILPLLNDLRAVRGESLLSETAMFKPDLESGHETGTKNAVTEDIPDIDVLLKKIRQLYQFALVGLIRNQDVDTNLGYVAKAMARLERLSGKKPIRQLWWVASAVIEGVIDGKIEFGTSVKMLLGMIDRQIKQIVDQEEMDLNCPVPKDLLKNLLYYVAKCDAQSPRIKSVREAYKLAEALPGDDEVDRERQALAGPTKEAFESVVEALSEELASFKETLDLFVRGVSTDVGELEGLIPKLKQITDTLAVLGLGIPRRVLQEQIDVVAKLIENGVSPGDSSLMEVASALLYVEATLGSVAADGGDESRNGQLVSPEQVGKAKEAVLRECRADLERAKETVIDYINSKWDPSFLEILPDLLTHVRGGLLMVPLMRPANLIDSCNRYVTQKLRRHTGAPDWQELDTFADAITSIEYYLERFSDQGSENIEILEIAEDSVKQLGFPVEPVVEAPAAVAVQETAIDDENQELDALEQELLEGESQIDSLELETSANELVEESAESVAPVAAAAAVEEAEEEDELIDEEIIEIFIEESDEVLEAINEYFPRWKANLEDNEALTEFRRAFHTLKGSGRMVGATVIGELAWSIENMLNRVIDNSVPATHVVVSLVEAVVGEIPALVKHFQERTKPSLNTTPLEAFANAIAGGNDPGSLDDALAAARGGAVEVAAEPEQVTQAVEVNDREALEISEEDFDPVLLDIFGTEASTHLTELESFLAKVEGSEGKITNDLLRALHTLKGSAHMAGVDVIASIATPTERLVKNLHGQGILVDKEIHSCLTKGAALIREGLEKLRGSENMDLEGINEYLALISRLEADRLEDVEQAAIEAKSSADANLISIFLAEGMDLIVDANEILSHWESNPIPDDELDSLRKQLRTLAGSAKTAELNDVEALSVALAECYNAIAEGLFKPNNAFFELAHESHEFLIGMVDRLATGHATESPKELVMALKGCLDSNMETDFEADSYIQPAAAEEFEAPALEPSASFEPSSGFESDSEQDAELVEIFLEEANDILDNTANALHRWTQDPSNLLEVEELQRDLHTLKGGARMAEISAIGDLAHQLEFIYEGLCDKRFVPSRPLSSLLQRSHDKLSEMLETLQQNQRCEAASELLVEIQRFIDAPAEFADTDEEDMVAAQVEEPIAATEPSAPAVPDADSSRAAELVANYRIDMSDVDPEIFEIFLEEADEITEGMDNCIHAWFEEPTNNSRRNEMQRLLHTLKGGARLAGLTLLGDLSHDFETFLIGAQEERREIDDVFMKLVHEKHDQVMNLLEKIRLQVSDIDASTTAPSEAVAAPVAEAQMQTAMEPAFNVAELEPEIVEIFLEEAEELTEGIESHIQNWLSEPEEGSHQSELQRLLHTLKGGARLAGLGRLGDLSHNFESFLIQAEEKNTPVDEAFFKQVHAKYDEVMSLVEAVRAQLQSVGDLSEFAASAAHGDDEYDSADESTNVVPIASGKIPLPTATQVASHTPSPMPQHSEPLPMDGNAAVARRAPQEMVKVSADLLEELVNLAGETSIMRGRVEQEVNDFNHIIDEVQVTIERVREQLRRLDIETEATILTRHVVENQYDEDFDPLEMDRYSVLHQLSRSLGESVSDLMDLKESLVDKTRDAETILLQQSRVDSELQEGLMRTRMVPFSRLIPRLRRIVRQVASELGKSVELEVINAEGEMDRTVLERIVAPLEHMLRNAVDHGIEMPDDRAKAGKNKTGRVTLHLTREGGEVVLRLSDDGRGMKIDNIRKQAIERGLMDKKATLTDNEVMQFIFRAGFSTAEKVTQISGRGVGMDVVHSEIKQLGGTVKIHSAPNVGSQFTVRLPFTVAVNRALMVKVAEDYYAIPLTHIEGIVRVNPYELETYYEDGAPMFEYAGQSYRMRYLGAFVHGVEKPNLVGQTRPIPVLLARGSEHSIALQVDSLVGSREIVVKAVGPQLSTVSGLSGATILGDGSVVIILDLVALIRADVAGQTHQRILEARKEQSKEKVEEVFSPTIMVVDDSVTVRKVTSRLLERNGMQVITAKDGVDAITHLQDHKPDLMLLDIEMPRMDGFEVATLIRHDERLKQLPIIMITSRTGEKHRERALSIGVNKYMGKPFQETELLRNIEGLLDFHA